LADQNPVWISSYPRSGNTLLRTILWQCFGQRSASRYFNDLGGNTELAEYIGHLEWGPEKQMEFPENNLPLFKTHEKDNDQNTAIYVIRDGRAVCVSFWRFYGDYFSLEDVVEGRGHKFGVWSDHVESWHPWDRPNTLLLRYEDMTGDLSTVLQSISAFLKLDIQAGKISDRDLIAGQAGRWVKQKSDWKAILSGDLLERFLEINGDTLKRAGYVD